MISSRLQMIELRHMAALVAVAEEQHFGRAAVRLGLTQPRISVLVQRLEELIGTRLVERRPTVSLTADGEALLPHVKAALARAEAGIRTMRRRREGVEGDLRVGFPTWILATDLPDRLVAFRNAHPHVRVELVDLPSNIQIEQVRSGGLDIGFVRAAPFHDEEIAFEPLLVDPWRVVVPQDHPLTARPIVRLQELESEQFVGFPEMLNPMLHRELFSLFDGKGFSPQVTQQAAEWMSIVGLVSAGAGVAIVPASIERLYSSNLAYLEIAGAEVSSTVCACTATTVDATTRKLMQFFSHPA